MDGNSAFKNYRVNNGLSVRKFASATQLSPRIVTSYENGEKAISNIPVFKAIRIFDIFQADIEEYFDIYYPYKNILDEKIEKWEKENPHILDYEILKHRMYLRLAKIKKRQSVPDEVCVRLYEEYNKNFEILKSKVDAKGNISDEDYMQYIEPINYLIKKGQHQLETDNRISYIIMENLLKTEYSIPDVATLCDISRQHLWRCVNGTFDFGKMRIDTALKLCYTLNMDFKEVFIK